MDELLARASLAVVPLGRARRLLSRLGGRLDSRRAFAVARALRWTAEALNDAADALEQWAEYASLREGRFGRSGGD